MDEASNVSMAAETKARLFKFTQQYKRRPGPITFQWLFPFILGGVCFKAMSICLHQATLFYVWHHEQNWQRTRPLGDMGMRKFGKAPEFPDQVPAGVVFHPHNSTQNGTFLGKLANFMAAMDPNLNEEYNEGAGETKKDVDYMLLFMDSMPVFILGVFIFGCIWLNDLRMWVKFWFSLSILFLMKGIMDLVTDIPDSAGWAKCERRLGQHVVQFMLRMRNLKSDEFYKQFFRLEMLGVEPDGGRKSIWKIFLHLGGGVRYCSDMSISGHTFTVCLAILALIDLTRKVTMNLAPLWSNCITSTATVFGTAFVLVEGGTILHDHFHYTIDILFALLIVWLIYTNAGMALLVHKFIMWLQPDDERSQLVDGTLFIPVFYNGHFEVKETEYDSVVRSLQGARKSILNTYHCAKKEGSAKDVGAKEVGDEEAGAKEVGAQEVGDEEAGTAEVGAKEVGAKDVGAKEVCAEEAA